MTKIRIYNGNQIGGCITSISTRNTKILIDFGENLPGTSADVQTFDWEKEKVSAVFFTHYHGDHVGRFKEIPDNIPLYIGKVTREVLYTIAKYVKDKKSLQILTNDKRIHEVKADVSITLGDMVITPYMVDHSAYDAYMYLVETPDETILHTGDFRGHGYRGKAVIPMLSKYVRRYGERDVDALIMEGTMLSRMSEKIYSEADMLRDAKKLFEEHKYVFLICSSTNVDSLATFYKAAKSQHIKMYANEYVCEQISHYRAAAKQYKGPYDFQYVYQYNPDWIIHSSKLEKPTRQEELMRKEGFLIVIKAEENYQKWIERFSDLNPIVVYSMWEGYLNQEHKAYNKEWKKFIDSCEQVKYMHTSGHATASLIAQVIHTIAPRQAIYPIHTEKGEKFKELAIDDIYKRRIVL